MLHGGVMITGSGSKDDLEIRSIYYTDLHFQYCLEGLRVYIK